MHTKKRWLIYFAFLLLILPTLYAEDELHFSVPSVNRILKIGNFLDIPIVMTGTNTQAVTLTFSVDGNISKMVTLSKTKDKLEPNKEVNLTLTLLSPKYGYYNGTLVIEGGLNGKIPLNLTVTDVQGIPIEAIYMEVEVLTPRVKIGDRFRFQVNIQNLLSEKGYNVTLHSSIDVPQNQEFYVLNRTFYEETEPLLLNTSLSTIKTFEVPDFIRIGEYVLNVEAEYLGLTSSRTVRFHVTESVLDFMILGILPLRWVLLVGGFIFCGSIVFVVYYRRRMLKKKRYTMKVDYGTLPQTAPRTVFIGRVAETETKAFFDIDMFTTHTLIAGSTGGGKTVSAEVLIEGALLKQAAVIVFDPTAQWTGMLRRCKEKKMLALYQKFGMKKSEARAFNGNIHQVLNSRELIDIKKFMKAGEITCFSINRLDPSDIDILVANTIRQIFSANLPESRELKLLVVFDEVHRLLPKFGGSGQGFIQIERACREFRKWGVGLFLISQVLSDFIGETKANISTEIQMRTRDENDLNRIKEKYGGEMLQSLVKASTGTGMVENAAYNNGNPYFISFRPLLHEHARLSDDELDNYNKYNNLIDDLDYEIDQLEKDGIDIFDLRLELKMALDKVKSGNFNMVDIYLEGLTPRIKDEWKKLGKQPKKREVQLVSEADLKRELLKAQEARKKFETEQSVKSKFKKKELEALRLKNGIVVMTPAELIDALKSMDKATFAKHVNDTENAIADWYKGFDDQMSDKLRAVKKKENIVRILQGEDPEPEEAPQEEKKEAEGAPKKESATPEAKK
jgi:hypothetical protein